MKKRSNYYVRMMSDDYDRLRKLLDDDQVVVCFVNYEYDTGGKRIMFRDVAKVKSNDYSQNSMNYGYVIEARGIVYGSWDRRMEKLRGVTFRGECERLGLQYLDIII